MNKRFHFAVAGLCALLFCTCAAENAQVPDGGDATPDLAGALTGCPGGCPTDQTCVESVCIAVPQHCPCPKETYCDLASNSCKVGCLEESHCGAPRHCNIATRQCAVGCSIDAHCGGGVCNPATKECFPAWQGFELETSFATGTYPFAMTVGDFDGDKKLDLAVANSTTNNVSVLIGNGTGGFAAATNFPVGMSPYSVAAADLDGDRKLDLVVANNVSSNLSVLFGTGTGSFGPATSYTAGTGTYSVATGDFDGDTKLDLAVVNATGNNVSILINNGKGSFGTATNFATGSAPYAVVTGDFNKVSFLPPGGQRSAA